MILWLFTSGWILSVIGCGAFFPKLKLEAVERREQKQDL